jgi:hypothetical protein
MQTDNLKNETPNDANNVLCEVVLSDLKQSFQKWSGFEMTASNLDEAQKEISDMIDTLSNEVYDYGKKLDAIAKKAFRDNLT